MATPSTSRPRTAQDIVILSGARTPIGKFTGTLAAADAPHLGAVAIKAAVERAGIDPAHVDEVLMGHVIAAGVGQAPARRTAMLGGMPDSVGAAAVNKVCGSGLKAVMLGAQAIRADDAQLIVAGGMESMSNAPHFIRGRGGLKYGNQQLTDAALHDGLWCSIENWGMGDAAEFIADEYEVTREAMDRFAYESHQKALAAQDAGKFKLEIAPVTLADAKGRPVVVDTDEGPRRDTSPELLAKLKPAFKPNGKVTAGNAPGLNDGAAAVVLAGRSYAEAHGKKPLARIVGYTQFAVPPKYLFIAPAHAIPKLLDKVGWTLADVDLVELNEAFAAQVLADGRVLADKGWDWARVNVNGGAVALGHPIGASGARLVVTLIHALQDRGLKRGIASLCLGGGEAVALAVEIE
ncbi:MAG: acetyl-CoA C-acetyltransferase [Chloroflexi bacterium]|nr:acetyl-CoA C-acetyltransferase [Chloroflexota bacterium]